MKRMFPLVLATLGFASSALAIDESKKSLDALEEAPERVVFSRDKLACCGTLTQLSIEKNDQGSYRVSLRRAYTDWVRHENVDLTEQIGSDLTCQFSNEIVICKQDLRVEDGPLTKLIFGLNDNGLYDAEKIAVPAIDDHASEVAFVKIASDLELLELR